MIPKIVILAVLLFAAPAYSKDKVSVHDLISQVSGLLNELQMEVAKLEGDVGEIRKRVTANELDLEDLSTAPDQTPELIVIDANGDFIGFPLKDLGQAPGAGQAILFVHEGFAYRAYYAWGGGLVIGRDHTFFTGPNCTGDPLVRQFPTLEAPLPFRSLGGAGSRLYVPQGEINLIPVQSYMVYDAGVCMPSDFGSIHGYYAVEVPQPPVPLSIVVR